MMSMTYRKFNFCFITLLSLLFVISACQKSDPIEEPAPDTQKVGVSNVLNPYATKLVSYRGATISLKFDASASWTAHLEFNTDEEDWASISSSTLSGEAEKRTTVRIAFNKNNTEFERSVELWITVDGYEAECIATLSQAASGSSVDAKLNEALNTFMHDILKDDYLFADAYNEQEIDLTVNYSDFLSTHLLSLGEVNVADGGYYRPTQPNAGQRFIYTNIVEIQFIGTKASQTAGLGFGPFISTALQENSTYMGISPAYVRRGSPVEAAGLRRGDIIFSVNGASLTTANYSNYMSTLYQGTSGSYQFSYLRFEEDGKGGYELKAYDSPSVSASLHIYDPVLHASILSCPDDPSVRIGYLVYESFDLSSQEFLEKTIDDFIDAGITDMILDLRFNAGGAVAQSRWLSGCIAGAANWEKTFTKVVYNNGATEDWKFDRGYTNDTDNLGLPKDLGLDRLYVITSYNTASAAELVISSLKGIDFPVKMIGCRTEGKNVGMTVSEIDYNGRRFQFAPVTFWVRNAKDWGDYPDGIEPDEYVNNDNTLTDDDADNVFPYSFSDWGNMDYNIALQWAYCDITGKERWTETPDTKTLSSFNAQQYVPEFIGTGNQIYKN